MTQQTYTSPAYARIQLRSSVTCPHCWESYKPDDTLWVAEDPSLLGDERLGSDEQRRFLPDRFDVEGNAVDRLDAAESQRHVLDRQQHVAGADFRRIVGRPHAAFSIAADTFSVFMSRILTRALSTPLRPSSNVTSVEISASVEPS